MSIYSKTILADTPIAYWRMGETSGTSIADSSGNSHSGTYASGVTLGQAGAIIGDTNLSVASGSAGVGSVALNLSAQPIITLEFWLYESSWTTDDRLAMEFTTNGSNAGGFYIDSNASAGGFDVKTGGASGYVRASFAQPSAAAWHYYAIVIDRTAGTFTVYVDAALKSLTYSNSGSLTGNFANDTLYLGSRAGSSLILAGRLDEVAIYAGALSAGRVLAHYQAGLGLWGIYPRTILADSPYAYFPGDLLGATATDGSGHARHGTYTGGVTLGLTGPLVGGNAPACKFDGSSGYLDLAALNSICGLLGSGATFEIWGKSPDQNRFVAVNNESAHDWVLIDVNGIHAGDMGTGFKDAAGNSVAAYTAGGLPTGDANWHHYATTIRPGATPTIELYFDGVAQSLTYNSQPATGSFGSSFAESLIVGALHSFGSVFAYADWAVAHAAFYAAPLSAARVLAHYQAGQAAGLPGRVIGPLRRAV
jgi:hypothetical protein